MPEDSAAAAAAGAIASAAAASAIALVVAAVSEASAAAAADPPLRWNERARRARPSARVQLFAQCGAMKAVVDWLHMRFGVDLDAESHEASKGCREKARPLAAGFLMRLGIPVACLYGPAIRPGFQEEIGMAQQNQPNQPNQPNRDQQNRDQQKQQDQGRSEANRQQDDMQRKSNEQNQDKSKSEKQRQ
jgi:hypothetical protein